ncbi:unnamed protein product [Cylindrotheca closterium]|uniref:Peptidase M20 dimerisation domain-containing protein n=1 Tax=Cylindrotheca closterium TaxID=2856 RepID=A0AAD2PXJ7_9STRA|nr:unnamed protein product [Cylindrotheca closterium]
MRISNSFRSLTSAILVASSRSFSSSALTAVASLSTLKKNNDNMRNRRLHQTVDISSTMIPGTSVALPPENLEAIAKLEPKSLWSHFAILSSIPRPSKQEEQILDYIKAFAEERNLKWKQDSVGNLVVFHPGCGVGKSAPAVILQGHVDMVTEKNSDTAHDFEKDPILLHQLAPIHNEQTSQKEQWLGAKGTTLGADNGIGVAATLALLETSVDDETAALPPLEALFTIDEETGLTGATELNAQELGLTGKSMLNLDTEEWGELYVGCSGGGESTITVPLTRGSTLVGDVEYMELRVDGLLGGHSGINIHEGRGNAILVCASAAQKALQVAPEGLSLVFITGGDKHNAIPREARALFAVSTPEAKNAIETAAQLGDLVSKAEYGILETKLSVVAKTATIDDTSEISPLDAKSAFTLLSILLALPHGPLKFSHSIPDLVETSNNIASIVMATHDSQATILCSTRSSIGDALEMARNKLEAIAFLGGATIERKESYPGWNPDMKSNLLSLGRKLVNRGTGREPGVKAIHAGLECGLLIEKMGGGVDALSFGPTITGAHSPDERILCDTVPPFFELVKEMLEELAKQPKD